MILDPRCRDLLTFYLITFYLNRLAPQDSPHPINNRHSDEGPYPRPGYIPDITDSCRDPELGDLKRYTEQGDDDCDTDAEPEAPPRLGLPMEEEGQVENG